MSVTLGLMLVLVAPPTASDADMAPPPAVGPPPATSAPTTPSTPSGSAPVTPPGPSASHGVTNDAGGPPPPGEPPAVADSGGATPNGEPADESDDSGSFDEPAAHDAFDAPMHPHALRDPFRSEPAELVGWMGYQTRSAKPMLPPPPPPRKEEPQYRRMFIGGYGGFSMRLSSVSRKLSTMSGFKGGILLGERLSLGGAAYQLNYRHNSNIRSPGGDEYSLRMSYGGFTLGVTVWRPGRFELAIEALAGAGVACISDNPRYRDKDYRCVETVRMFVGEPAVTLYYHVTHWMRAAVTAGYRVVVREAWRPPNDFLLSGGYGGLDLQFGWFKKPPRRR